MGRKAKKNKQSNQEEEIAKNDATELIKDVEEVPFTANEEHVIEGKQQELPQVIEEEIIHPREEISIEDIFAQMLAQKKLVLFNSENLNSTLDILKQYRSHSELDIITNIDLESETKEKILELFYVLGWINDIHHTIYVAALNNEWEIAKNVSRWESKHWSTLKKLIGNWDFFRNRRQLKDLCLHLINLDPKAMPTLNKWAIDHAKELKRVIKGYCDLCISGEGKMFAMQYSEL
jgi:hypothetical protein